MEKSCQSDYYNIRDSLKRGLFQKFDTDQSDDGVFRGPLPYYKNVVMKIIHRKKMAHSVKNDVFHKILVNFSKYNLKKLQISTNFINMQGRT